MLAAFVGILDDQAVQESLPGEALHEMAENLMFPLLQVRTTTCVLIYTLQHVRHEMGYRVE